MCSHRLRHRSAHSHGAVPVTADALPLACVAWHPVLFEAEAAVPTQRRELLFLNSW